jgi:hypothetical protein
MLALPFHCAILSRYKLGCTDTQERKGMSSTDQRVQVDHLRIWIRQMRQEIWRHVSPRHELLYSRTRLLPKHRRQMAMA